MLEKKNNIEKIREINKEWINEFEEDPQLKPLILVYEPFSEKYWEEKYRIVWCNLEPGGYIENKNDQILRASGYRGLLEKKNQSTIRTSLFIYCLYNKLNGIEIDDKQREVAKKNLDLLMEYMNKVTYMNLIKDMNNDTNIFDKKYFWNFFNVNIYPKNRERTIDFIEALDPDIFIITGEAGKDLFQQLYNKDFDKKYYSFVNNNTLFVNLDHPSPRGVWNEKYISDNVNMIIEYMKLNKLLK